MGLPLTHPAEGSVGWFSSFDANLTKLENEFVGRQNSDASVVTVSGTTAETVLMTSTSIPANTLLAGMVLAFFSSGTVTIPATSTPSVTFRLRWGGLGGTLLWSFTWLFGSNPTPYDLGWGAEHWIVCVSPGASGSIDQMGWTFAGTGFSGGLSTGAVTIDTTATKQLVWTVQPSLSTVTVTQRLMVANRG